MVTPNHIIQAELDPSLTILFKETNPYHPDTVGEDCGENTPSISFGIIIDDWNEGTYTFVNSVREKDKTSNTHFTPHNQKPLKTIKDLNTLWKAITGRPLTYIGKRKKEKKETEYKKNKVGEIHESNSYGKVEIIEQISAKNMKIRFLEDGTTLDNQQYGRIVRGQVKNSYKRIYYGVGYIGVGKYNSSDKEAYKKWQNMLQRCYDKEYHIKHPSYKKAVICDEWCNFQIFAEWFKERYDPQIMRGWALDKDLFSGDIKIYSPDTCCFIPQIINSLLIHIHTTPKVTDIKGRYYTKIHKRAKVLRFSVFDEKGEAISQYKDEKRKYAVEILSQYSSLLPDKVVDKIQGLIDSI